MRQTCFLGEDDTYKALKMTLKAGIDQGAWESLNIDVCQPFDKPVNGQVVIKVINLRGMR